MDYFNIKTTNMEIFQKNNEGYLSLIVGPMYSGKTTTILELKKKYDLTNMKSLVINYAEDKRYDSKLLSTHDKRKINCMNLYNLTDIMKQDILQFYDIFLINEGQFFQDLKDVVIELVDKYNKKVYIAGLDGDFERNGFTQIKELYSYADEIIKKYSICVECKTGKRALFSYRLTNEREQKVIGADNYIPLCRSCYNRLYDK